MNPITLFPVHDVEQRLLVPAGTELTEQFMTELCRSNTDEYAALPLLEYGTIRKDLLGQFAIRPYNAIFADEEIISSVLNNMARMHLPEPLLKALEFFRANDYHTYRHMLIISALSTLILQNLPARYSSKKDNVLLQVGPTHDIGKISVPVEILLKKTPLTLEELNLLKHHSIAGYVFLSYYYKDHTALAPLIARDHHERRNGTGYPRGIQQDNFTTEITTVCDIYDALIAKRPYRPISYDNRTALEELTWMAQRGDIGMECVRILVAFNRQRRTDMDDCPVSMERRGTTPENNMYGEVVKHD